MTDTAPKKIERLSTGLEVSTIGRDIINKTSFKRYSDNFLGERKPAIKIITINSKIYFT